MVGNAISFKYIISVLASLKMLEVTESPNVRCGNMWWSRYSGSLWLRAASCFIFLCAEIA